MRGFSVHWFKLASDEKGLLNFERLRSTLLTPERRYAVRHYNIASVRLTVVDTPWVITIETVTS